MKRYLIAAAMAAAAGIVAAPASAASIINGSFELGTNPGATFSTLAAGSSAITGWTIGGAGVDYIGGYWNASDGQRSVDLSALSAGGVSQNITTVAGKTYKVTFDMAGNPDGGLGSRVMVITSNGFGPQINNFTVGAANTRTNMGWQSMSYTFTAGPGTTTTIAFASDEYNPFGPALDNVSISSAVPEASTWALITLGFGAAGGMIRRSRRRNALLLS